LYYFVKNNFQVCCEKRLVAAHELSEAGAAKGSAYGELGDIHCSLGNYEQAISCLDRQLSIVRYVLAKIIYA
jgi:tetratricopeptide (TPR) repeat protein